MYRLVHGFLKFKSKLDRKAVAQDKAKTEPLCMAQYFRVLTTYRSRLTGNIFTASVNIFPQGAWAGGGPAAELGRGEQGGGVGGGGQEGPLVDSLGQGGWQVRTRDFTSLYCTVLYCSVL